jgi:hypothetical protein
MQLSVFIELDDNAKPDEIDYALREVARVAGSNILTRGIMDIDGEYDLSNDVPCVWNASVFRPA